MAGDRKKFIIEMSVKGGKLSAKDITGISKSAKFADRSTKKLSMSMVALRSALPIAGLALLAKSFIAAASEAEQYRVRLNILLRSQKEGNRMFKEMGEYASRVPFEYKNVMQSATSLAGVMKGGVDEVKEWIPLIGDLAAVAGLSIEKSSEQVIRMYAAGAASADLFRERGILAMLGFEAGVSYSAEETRKKLMSEWTKTDSQFRGATDKLAETWQGKMSMMKDAWFNFQVSVMESGLLEYFKDIVEELTHAINIISKGTILTGLMGRYDIVQQEIAKKQKLVSKYPGMPLTEVRRELQILEWRSKGLLLMMEDARAAAREATKAGAGIGPGAGRGQFIPRGVGPEGPRQVAGGLWGGKRDRTPGLPGMELMEAEEMAEPAIETFEQIYSAAAGFQGRMITIFGDISSRLPSAFENASIRISETFDTMTFAAQDMFDVMISGSGNAAKAFARSMLTGLGATAKKEGQYWFLKGLATVWMNPAAGAQYIATGLGLMALGSTLGSAGAPGGRGSGGGGGGFRSSGDRDTGPVRAGGAQVIIINNGRAAQAAGGLAGRMVDQAIDDRVLAARIKHLIDTGEAFSIQ